MKTKMLMLMLCLVGLVFAGCTHNLTTMDQEQLYARTTTANVGSIDAEGNQQAVYHGIGATILKQDAEGNWTNMPGPVGVLSAPMPGENGGVAFIISPKDTKIAKIMYTPDPAAGEPAVVVEGVEANISEPMSQQVAALAIALPILKDMTIAEAQATVEKWKVAETITPTIAELLLQIIGTWIAP